MKRTLNQSALRLATELSTGEFPEELEPQELAWLLRQLVEANKAPAWMREFIDAVDKLAFMMQPPNIYTPQFAQLCIEAKRRLGE